MVDRPTLIRAGRPIYRVAFSRILNDIGFAGAMTIRTNKVYIKQETKKIEDSENELTALASLQSAFIEEPNKEEGGRKPTKTLSWWWGWLGYLRSSRSRDKADIPTKHLPGLPNELHGRVIFLLATIKKSQNKIEKFQEENDKISSVITSL